MRHIAPAVNRTLQANHHSHPIHSTTSSSSSRSETVYIWVDHSLRPKARLRRRRVRVRRDYWLVWTGQPGATTAGRRHSLYFGEEKVRDGQWRNESVTAWERSHKKYIPIHTWHTYDTYRRRIPCYCAIVRTSLFWKPGRTSIFRTRTLSLGCDRDSSNYRQLWIQRCSLAPASTEKLCVPNTDSIDIVLTPSWSCWYRDTHRHT